MFPACFFIGKIPYAVGLHERVVDVENDEDFFVLLERCDVKRTSLIPPHFSRSRRSGFVRGEQTYGLCPLSSFFSDADLDMRYLLYIVAVCEQTTDNSILNIKHGIESVYTHRLYNTKRVRGVESQTPKSIPACYMIPVSSLQMGHTKSVVSALRIVTV